MFGNIKNSENLTSTEKGIFVGYFLGQNVLYMAAIMFIPIMWDSVYMIVPLAAGLMFFVVKVIDALCTPVWATMIQKSNSKYGKFRPWAIMGALVLPLLLIIALVGSGINSSALTMVYAFVTFLIFTLVYAMVDIPAYSLSFTTTKKPEERSKLILFFKIGAGLAGLFAPLLFVGGFKLFQEMWGPNTAMLVLASISAIIIWILMLPIWKVNERGLEIYEKENKEQQTVTLKEMFRFWYKNKPLLILTSSFLVVYTVMAALNGLYFYTFFSYLGVEDGRTTVWYLLSTIIGGLIGFSIPTIFMTFLHKYEKHTIYKLSATIGLIFSLLMFPIIIITNSPVAFMLVYWSFAAISTSSSIFFYLYIIDCVDYSNYANGSENTALGFASKTFTGKLAQGSGWLFTFIVLAIIYAMVGLDTSESLGDSEMGSFVCFLVYMLLIFVIFGWIIFAFSVLFKLDKSRLWNLKHGNTQYERLLKEDLLLNEHVIKRNHLDAKFDSSLSDIKSLVKEQSKSNDAIVRLWRRHNNFVDRQKLITQKMNNIQPLKAEIIVLINLDLLKLKERVINNWKVKKLWHKVKNINKHTPDWIIESELLTKKIEIEKVRIEALTAKHDQLTVDIQKNFNLIVLNQFKLLKSNKNLSFSNSTKKINKVNNIFDYQFEVFDKRIHFEKDKEAVKSLTKNLENIKLLFAQNEELYGKNIN